ncbi:unnamed protein product [Soboliphyme baturini]|uniref:NumbF domain-containing protein n=1 Tax=Soboliphyme baturini TaxID=241478 RepID=A0A183ITS7_9BILA|nr:unnamed protein product [Soboliphyme baturini]
MRYVVLPHAIARPQSNLSLLERQGSLRLSCASPVKSNFRRFNSLRLTAAHDPNAVCTQQQPLRLEFIKEEEDYSAQGVRPLDKDIILSASKPAPAASSPKSQNGDSIYEAGNDRFNGGELNDRFRSFDPASNYPQTVVDFPSPTRMYSRGEEWLNSTTEKVKALRRQRSVDFQDSPKPPPVPPRRVPFLLRSSQSVTLEDSQRLKADTSPDSFSPDIQIMRHRPLQLGVGTDFNINNNNVVEVTDPFDVKWNSFGRTLATCGGNPFTEDEEETSLV